MNALWSSLTDHHLIFRTSRDAQSAVVVHADWTLSVTSSCVCVCVRCVFCSLVITVFVFLQVIIGHAVSSVINQLTNDYYKCFCVAGEGGNSEVYWDADVTDGSSRLCELQWDAVGRLPHHHLDNWTQELWRQKGADSLL